MAAIRRSEAGRGSHASEASILSGLREIAWDDLESLALGTGVLGTGGGGDSYMALLNAEKLYRQGKRYELIDPSALGDDDLIAEISYMGAPLVIKERLPDPEHCSRPVRAMERYMGKRFAAVMSTSRNVMS